MSSIVKRSWVEINLQTLKNNYSIYRNRIPIMTSMMVVVKADGYGHGAVNVAEAAQSLGCDNFAVSNILEAIELRNAGIKGQILVLGYTPIEKCDELVAYDISQAVISERYAEDLINTGFSIKCQCAIDTGMNRIGIDADDPTFCEKQIRYIAEKLTLTGMFTHLCVADTSENSCVDFTETQILKFKTIAERISDLKLPYVHCLNTAGGLLHYNDISNLCRLGISLYGLKPNYSFILPDGIEPVMTWKSVISMIKDVYPGETIGYGRSYIVKNKMRVATIPTGYADGYNRALSNKGFILVNGKKAPIIGRVCMDQFMVDVTDVPDAKVYGEVILIGKSGAMEINADDMAEMLDTIGYEIICDIGKRVPRVYRLN